MHQQDDGRTELKCTEFVALDQRPTTGEYDRYVAIIAEMRALGYDAQAMWEKCSFKVADVGTNAIAARADADLLEVAHAIDRDGSEAEAWVATAKQGLLQLWDGERQRFLSIDLRTGERLLPATGATALASWSGMLTEEQLVAVGKLLDEWEGAAGALVPSCDPAAPEFAPYRYWRGPVWVNVNWMVAEGMRGHGEEARADRIAAHTRRLIEQSGMHEYFNPATGEGLGATDFGWTAALARYWLGME